MRPSTMKDEAAAVAAEATARVARLAGAAPGAAPGAADGKAKAKKRRRGDAERLRAPKGATCFQCNQAKTKCCGNIPCTRCFRMNLPCRKRLTKAGGAATAGAGGRASDTQSAGGGYCSSGSGGHGGGGGGGRVRGPGSASGGSGGTGSGSSGSRGGAVDPTPIIDLVIQKADPRPFTEIYMQAFSQIYNEGLVDYDKVLRMLRLWNVASTIMEGDLSWGVGARIAQAMGINGFMLEDPQAMLLDIPEHARKLRAQQEAFLAIQDTKRLKETDLFKMAGDGIRGVYMDVKLDDRTSRATNDIYDAMHRSATDMTTDLVNRKTLVALLTASLVAPEDRFIYFRGMIEMLFSKVERKQTNFFKLFSKDGEVRLYISEGRPITVDGYPGILCTLERVPLSKYITSRTDTNTVIDRFRHFNAPTPAPAKISLGSHGAKAAAAAASRRRQRALATAAAAAGRSCGSGGGSDGFDAGSSVGGSLASFSCSSGSEGEGQGLEVDYASAGSGGHGGEYSGPVAAKRQQLHHPQHAPLRPVPPQQQQQPQAWQVDVATQASSSSSLGAAGGGCDDDGSGSGSGSIGSPSCTSSPVLLSSAALAMMPRAPNATNANAGAASSSDDDSSLPAAAAAAGLAPVGEGKVANVDFSGSGSESSFPLLYDNDAKENANPSCPLPPGSSASVSVSHGSASSVISATSSSDRGGGGGGGSNVGASSLLFSKSIMAAAAYYANHRSVKGGLAALLPATGRSGSATPEGVDETSITAVARGDPKHPSMPGMACLPLPPIKEERKAELLHGMAEGKAAADIFVARSRAVLSALPPEVAALASGGKGGGAGGGGEAAVVPAPCPGARGAGPLGAGPEVDEGREEEEAVEVVSWRGTVASASACTSASASTTGTPTVAMAYGGGSSGQQYHHHYQQQQGMAWTGRGGGYHGGGQWQQQQQQAAAGSMPVAIGASSSTMTASSPASFLVDGAPLPADMPPALNKTLSGESAASAVSAAPSHCSSTATEAFLHDRTIASMAYPSSFGSTSTGASHLPPPPAAAAAVGFGDPSGVGVGVGGSGGGFPPGFLPGLRHQHSQDLGDDGGESLMAVKLEDLARADDDLAGYTGGSMPSMEDAAIGLSTSTGTSGGAAVAAASSMHGHGGIGSIGSLQPPPQPPPVDDDEFSAVAAAAAAVAASGVMVATPGAGAAGRETPSQALLRRRLGPVPDMTDEILGVFEDDDFGSFF